MTESTELTLVEQQYTELAREFQIDETQINKLLKHLQTDLDTVLEVAKYQPDVIAEAILQAGIEKRTYEPNDFKSFVLCQPQTSKEGSHEPFFRFQKQEIDDDKAVYVDLFPGVVMGAASGVNPRDYVKSKVGAKTVRDIHAGGKFIAFRGLLLHTGVSLSFKPYNKVEEKYEFKCSSVKAVNKKTGNEETGSHPISGSYLMKYNHYKTVYDEASSSPVDRDGNPIDTKDEKSKKVPRAYEPSPIFEQVELYGRPNAEWAKEKGQEAGVRKCSECIKNYWFEEPMGENMARCKPTARAYFLVTDLCYRRPLSDDELDTTVYEWRSVQELGQEPFVCFIDQTNLRSDDLSDYNPAGSEGLPLPPLNARPLVAYDRHLRMNEKGRMQPLTKLGVSDDGIPFYEKRFMVAPTLVYLGVPGDKARLSMAHTFMCAELAHELDDEPELAKDLTKYGWSLFHYLRSVAAGTSEGEKPEFQFELPERPVKIIGDIEEYEDDIDDDEVEAFLSTPVNQSDEAVAEADEDLEDEDEDEVKAEVESTDEVDELDDAEESDFDENILDATEDEGDDVESPTDRHEDDDEDSEVQVVRRRRKPRGTLAAKLKANA